MRWISLCALFPIGQYHSHLWTTFSLWYDDPLVLGAIPKCDKTVITQQRTIEAQGLKVNFTISECADADKKHFKPPIKAEVRSISGAERRTTELDASLELAKRQTSICRLPAPHCICDIPCKYISSYRNKRQLIISNRYQRPMLQYS